MRGDVRSSRERFLKEGTQGPERTKETFNKNHCLYI